MTDLRQDFRNWLVNIKEYKESTADTYIRLINNICKNDLDNNWHDLSENIIPLLIKYHELANKEYYIDRVTIWHTLDYFLQLDTLLNPLKKTRKDVKSIVKLYLCCYEGDFFIDAVDLKNILAYVHLFNSFCYRQHQELQQFSWKEHQDFFRKIETIISEQHINRSSVYDSALHIVYERNGVNRVKNALSHYCNFLYNQTGKALYDYKNNLMLAYITIENPHNRIGGNYKIKCPLTGEQPLQIELKDNTRVYNHDENDVPSFVLILKDLEHIFNLDKKTIKKYFLNNGPINRTKGCEIKNIDRQNTVLRTYFCIDSVNTYLAQHHHPVKSKNVDVDYTLKGYEHWITRKEATDLLEISHNSFHTLVKPTNCSYLNYVDNGLCSSKDNKSYKYHRYYKPDLTCLKTRHLITSAKDRKLKYLTKRQ